MASIPGLNTLRTGRRGLRLRGRADRAIPANPDDEFNERALEAGRDQIIQQTDHDASISRMSAVSLGYLEDPYASLFIAPGTEIPRRYPIINRGTFVRSTAVDQLVSRFLKTSPGLRKQIFSLGAGSDTRFFRLCCAKAPDKAPRVAYHELDFETNIGMKRDKIRNNSLLSTQVADAEKHGAQLFTCAIDLRDLTSKSPPIIPNLDPDLPTLLLSECCLCYLPPDAAASVVQYFTMHLKNQFALVLYEPVRPFDAFGRTMVSNLGSRGIHLQTLKRYSSLDAQRQRLRLAGFSDGQGARDVHQLWEAEDWVSAAERERVEKLEWLDELEEWKLLASHYCVAWGWRGDVFSEAWQRLAGLRTTVEDRDEVA